MNSRIIEGTGKEIGSVSLGEPFASARLRIYVDQETDANDDSDIPLPSFAVLDEMHLESLLIASLNSPTQSVTSDTWNALRDRINSRTTKNGK